MKKLTHILSFRPGPVAIATCLAAASLRGQPVARDVGPQATNHLSLEQVVAEVRSTNPSLKAARADWEAMKQRVPQARAWDDPRASLDLNAARFVSVMPNSFSDQKLMVEQKLPISGRNRLQGRAATAEAASAFEAFRRRELDAVQQARAAYYEMANAAVQLDINRKNSALLRQFAEISRSRFETGSQSQADVLAADTETARLDEAAFDWEREISRAQSRLNTLMNRPPGAALAPPVLPDFRPVELSLTGLEAQALQCRPEIFIAQRKIDAAQNRLDAARRESTPEPSVRVEGDRYNGGSQVVSEVDVGFSIDLPWFNRARHRASVNENERALESARHELDAVRAETARMVFDQFKTVETFHHHTELYHAKLLPLAAQTVNALRLDYETGKTSFLELLSAQKNAREVESMYWDHLAHYHIALAELEDMIGAPPPDSAAQSSPDTP